MLVSDAGLFDPVDAGTEASHPGRAWIRYGRLVFAAVLFLVGVFLVSQSASLGYEERGAPGPGFFPFWVGAILAILSACWGVAEFRATLASQVEQDLDPRGIYRVIRLVVAIAILIAIFEPVGYNLSTLAFMIFLTFTMGAGRVWIKVVVSLAASFGVYLAFENFLGVSLPNSFLPFMSAVGL